MALKNGLRERTQHSMRRALPHTDGRPVFRTMQYSNVCSHSTWNESKKAIDVLVLHSFRKGAICPGAG